MIIKESFILDPTILETPTYVLSIVLLSFLILSLGLDWSVHFVKNWLLRKGRAGLSTAFDKAVMELTILGFVSIILLLFRGYAESICIPYSETQVRWTLLNDIYECPCCMASTTGVTTCAQMYHSCAFDSSSGEPYCGCEGEAQSSTYAPYTAPPPSSENAATIANGGAEGLSGGGEEEAGTCVAYADNERGFIFYQLSDRIKEISMKIGQNATEICRRILSDVPSLINMNTTSTTAPIPGDPPLRRLLQEETTSPSSFAATLDTNQAILNETAHVIPDIPTFRCEGPFPAGECPEGQIPAIGASALDQVHLLVFLISCMHVAASVVVVALATLRMRQWRYWQTQYLEELRGKEERNEEDIKGDNRGVVDSISRKVSVEESLQAGLQPPAPLPQEEELNDPEKGIEKVQQEISSYIPTLSQQLSTSTSAPAAAPPAWRRKIQNALYIFGRSFIPIPVSKSSFLTMRSHYLNYLGLPPHFDFVDECTISLDYDLSRVIGASLQMWVILVFVWVVVGLAVWVISLFLIVSALITIAINILMVSTINSSCEESLNNANRPAAVRAATHWYNDFRTLAIPLGGVIFYCSMMFTLVLFISWQFGAGSCFLDGKKNGQGLGGLPYWASIIISGVVLLWLASVTVPMWALVVHMRPHESWIQAAAMGGEEEEQEDGPVQDENGRGKGRIGKRASTCRRAMTMSGKSVEWEAQTDILAEINRLQEKLLEMQ